MPWCPACQRFLSQPTVSPSGCCPACGGEVEAGRGRVAAAERDQGGEGASAGWKQEDLPPVPWHLKLLGGAAVVYLGWRLVEGVVWVVDHI
ncbi:MAG: hypothetical protein ACRDY7_00570 [Acidimicrobiia bacterium]